ncbi:hypothetical protein P22_3107 [Propionispora sp. 2/2-37]|uniref:phosphoribosylanthranilate isomerase n=1 Tax=Propionispora sp. 2/2-37 TaxID=1677858 RepID=UPI0006C22E6C|nr:phosphoribosylanthranilate isomerase [Propionispora sp. 2/2-37]CUH96981.1 hypothetical protein P22_3107 [Propionispora sp. 2/2-37]
MSRIIIKICGIKTASAAAAVTEGGADLVGFVFAPSRRRISVTDAQALALTLSGIAKVGVFVNEKISRVNEIAHLCNLDYVQLSGDESAAYCRQVNRPVIKALQVGKVGFWDKITNYKVRYLLLDTFVPGSYGGTGKVFDWQIIEQVRSISDIPVFIAGGLKAENVALAMAKTDFQGVDVSGGVETAGEKDPAKILAFIQVVRKAERVRKNA